MLGYLVERSAGRVPRQTRGFLMLVTFNVVQDECRLVTRGSIRIAFSIANRSNSSI
jgi:hypothetical protein